MVDSLNATEQAISRLIEEHEGFLAESDQSSLAQNQRRATWRVRLPVAHFQAFTSAVARLGEVQTKPRRIAGCHRGIHGP